MAKKPSIEFDMEEFKKTHRYFGEKDFPKAMAGAFKLIAEQVQDATQKQTRSDFELHTDFIPKQIQAFPKTKGQVRKIESDIRNKGKFIASVSGTDRISFMSMHDEGGTRKNVHPAKYLPSGEKRDVIAVPGDGLKKLKFKSSTGKTKNKYKPKKLLELFNKNAPKSRRGRKLAFIMRAKSGHLMIVRRLTKKSNPIEVLYHFLDSTYIDDDWNFTEKGEATVKKIYQKSFADVWRIVNGQSPLKQYRKYGEGKGVPRK